MVDGGRAASPRTRGSGRACRRVGASCTPSSRGSTASTSTTTSRDRRWSGCPRRGRPMTRRQTDEPAGRGALPLRAARAGRLAGRVAARADPHRRRRSGDRRARAAGRAQRRRRGRRGLRAGALRRHGHGAGVGPHRRRVAARRRLLGGAPDAGAGRPRHGGAARGAAVACRVAGHGRRARPGGADPHRGALAARPQLCAPRPRRAGPAGGGVVLGAGVAGAGGLAGAPGAVGGRLVPRRRTRGARVSGGRGRRGRRRRRPARRRTRRCWPTWTRTRAPTTWCWPSRSG